MDELLSYTVKESIPDNNTCGEGPGCGGHSPKLMEQKITPIIPKTDD